MCDCVASDTFRLLMYFSVIVFFFKNLLHIKCHFWTLQLVLNWAFLAISYEIEQFLIYLLLNCRKKLCLFCSLAKASILLICRVKVPITAMLQGQRMLASCYWVRYIDCTAVACLLLLQGTGWCANHYDAYSGVPVSWEICCIWKILPTSILS